MSAATYTVLTGVAFGELRRIDGRAVRTKRTCWEKFHGLPVPCASCPLQRGSSVAACGSRLVVVLRRDRTTADLASFAVDAELVGAVQSIWLQQLKKTRRLSSQEGSVLDGLMLGRTHADIAEMLGISARTVRFHQENVLAKLGAESRLDLLRVLIDGRTSELATTDEAPARGSAGRTPLERDAAGPPAGPAASERRRSGPSSEHGKRTPRASGRRPRRKA